jgi:hypothetical protein
MRKIIRYALTRSTTKKSVWGGVVPIVLSTEGYETVGNYVFEGTKKECIEIRNRRNEQLREISTNETY